MTARLIVILLAVSLFAVACSSAPDAEGEIVGVVTEVSGGLTMVESFVILDADGNSHKFVPAESMTVMGAPPSHLRDHIISGDQVTVIYHQNSQGELVADDVVHA